MHLRLVIMTSLNKSVFLDLHLKVELKSSVGCANVTVDECESFDCSCSTLPKIFNLIHSIISFSYTEVHVKNNSISVPLTTKSLMIDLFSISPPLLLIITGPECMNMSTCNYKLNTNIVEMINGGQNMYTCLWINLRIFLTQQPTMYVGIHYILHSLKFLRPSLLKHYTNSRLCSIPWGAYTYTF